MNKKLANVIASIDARLKKNTLSEDAAALWEEVRSAFEALAEDDAEHTITELNDKYNELAAKYEQQAAEGNEEIAERIQKLRNEIMSQFGGQKVENKMTKEVREEIANAIAKCRHRDEVKDAIKSVLVKNDISGADFDYVIRKGFEIEHKPVQLFDDFGRTDLDHIYLAGIDESNAAQIAHQWTDDPSEQKAVQELAANGVSFSPKYVYKLQRLAQEQVDSAREDGRLADVEASITSELERQVKRMAERAALVGDNVNTGNAKVTTFETIGTVTTSNGKITVVNPAVANNVTLIDLATAADAVEGEPSEKVCVITPSLARTISAFLYGTGGSETVLSDEQIASQIGVSRLVKVDYLSEETGLHAIILRPDAYKVRIKGEQAVAFPQYLNNSLYYMYELNMAGALAELKSAAVLREA